MENRASAATLFAPGKALNRIIGYAERGRLLALETHRDKYTVYVRPELVVEIAYSDLQESPRYPGGLALRFARVKNFREDKSADPADTIQSVRSLFEESRR